MAVGTLDLTAIFYVYGIGRISVHDQARMTIISQTPYRKAKSLGREIELSVAQYISSGFFGTIFNFPNLPTYRNVRMVPWLARKEAFCFGQACAK